MFHRSSENKEVFTLVYTGTVGAIFAKAVELLLILLPFSESESFLYWFLKKAGSGWHWTQW